MSAANNFRDSSTRCGCWCENGEKERKGGLEEGGGYARKVWRRERSGSIRWRVKERGQAAVNWSAGSVARRVEKQPHRDEGRVGGNLDVAKCYAAITHWLMRWSLRLQIPHSPILTSVTCVDIACRSRASRRDIWLGVCSNSEGDGDEARATVGRLSSMPVRSNGSFPGWKGRVDCCFGGMSSY